MASMPVMLGFIPPPINGPNITIHPKKATWVFGKWRGHKWVVEEVKKKSAPKMNSL